MFDLKGMNDSEIAQFQQAIQAEKDRRAALAESKESFTKAAAAVIEEAQKYAKLAGRGWEDALSEALPTRFLDYVALGGISLDAAALTWKEPQSEDQGYPAGAVVIYEGEVYESVVDGNLASPKAYPQGWKKR